jgi:hypothetical protein
MLMDAWKEDEGGEGGGVIVGEEREEMSEAVGAGGEGAPPMGGYGDNWTGVLAIGIGHSP